ncbi:AGAP006323-PA [Anopheles gambiae str. PEST]|uniref:AGAP006323-PA n=1 Tax=Anopheles gambiae TaxID=7165 RepID=A7UU71_ANOGA|nr:AGAP006323-PA [Anopheles gambiae str. PEST]
MSTVKRITRNASRAASKSRAQTEAALRNSSRSSAKDKLRNITNTIGMSTGEEAAGAGGDPPAKKKLKSDPINSLPCSASPKAPPFAMAAAGAAPSQSELVPFEKLLLVLGRNYFDVCQRLALDYVPRCVHSITDCAQRHANKRSPRAKCVGSLRQLSTHDQLLEHRPDQFVEFVNQAILRQEFIDAELFVAGLQLMLTFNRPSEELRVDYGVAEIVDGTGEALETCLEHFPPCRWDLRPTYQRIVMGRLDAACFGRCDQREGLFRNVLHLIERDIETQQEGGAGNRRLAAGSKKGTTRRRTSEEEDDDAMMYNYNTWMLTNRMCYDFDRLARPERFQRLFAVLRVLVKLLEMDLAMWMLRNPTRTQHNLCNPTRNPLVAQLVWNGDYGSVNLFVKKLFQMFINMNALQYPQEDIAVVSRLLNLLTVAVNLSEFQHSDGQIEYPCAKDNSQHYARQLWKTLETSGYFSITLALRTIRNLRSPFLRLRLSEHLLQKLNRGARLSTVRCFFKQLHERCWLECSDQEPAEEGDAQQTEPNHYPVLNAHRTRPKVTEMHQKQYVEVLLTGLRAYCDMHQLPAYFREIMTRPVQGGGCSVSPSDESALVDGARIVVPKAVDDERMIFRGIAISADLVLEYRDDVKYLLLIEQQLKTLQSAEERALFGDWFAFLSEVDPTMGAA